MSARSRYRFSLMIVVSLVLAAMLANAPSIAQMPSDARIDNPAAADEPAPAAVDAVDEQHELALTIFPSLLELGLDVVPSDDQATSVLTAVNALRRKDNQRPFAALDSEAAAYVEQKVAAYRAQQLLTIRIQGALEALGFDPGPIDGLYGPLTTEAVRRYQRSAGLPPNGVLTAEQVDALEMKSILQPAGPKVPPADAKTPRGDADAVVATPAKPPEIDPDLLDYIGR
jgi:hypothetical protein